MRSGISSSSTASSARPRPPFSASLSLAARTSSFVALSTEFASCCESWYRTTQKSPAPSSRMMRPNVATYQIVRRSRRRTRRSSPSREVFPSVTKTVSGASDRLNQFRWVIVVDLPPQSANQNLEDVGEGVVVLVPHVRGDRGSVDNLPVMQNEELEQREFFRRQLNGSPGATYSVTIEIYLQVGDLHRL